MNRHLSEYRVHRKSSVYGGCCSRNLLQTASEGGQRAAVYAVGSWRPHVSMCHSSGMSKFLILLVLCKCQRSGDTAWVLSWSLSPPPLSWAISQEHRRTVPGVILRLCKDLDWSNIVPGKGFPGGTEVKKIHLPMQEMKETPVWSLGQEDPWRWKWQPTPVFLPGESRGQRKLTGYSPWGCRVRHKWVTEQKELKRSLWSFLLHQVLPPCFLDCGEAREGS